MGRLIKLLEFKENLEKHIINQLEHLIDQLPYGTLRRTFSLALIAIVVLFAFSTMLKSSGSDLNIKYTLVEPGQYRARVCSQWKFEENTSSQLEQALKSIQETAVLHNTSVLSGNQLGIPFCVLEVQGKGTLLNPKLVSRRGVSTEYTVKLNSLCGPHNTSLYKAKLSQGISLSWLEPSGQTAALGHFEGQLAHELQVALLVLRGEDVCQNKMTTVK